MAKTKVIILAEELEPGDLILRDGLDLLAPMRVLSVQLVGNRMILITDAKHRATTYMRTRFMEVEREA